MDFCYRVENGQALYDLFNSIGLTAFLILAFLQMPIRKKLIGEYSRDLMQRKHRCRIFASPYFYAVAEIAVQFLTCGIAIAYISPAWAHFITNCEGNFFSNIYFLPLLLFLVCALLKASPAEQLDLWALCVAVNLIFAKIACFCAGCCYGKEVSHSIYYQAALERYEVPIQAIECLVAIVITAALFWYSRHKKTAGTVYPMFILLYCGTRFCTEFWRGDFPPIALSLNINHFQCLAGILLGIILLLVVKKASNSPLFRTGFTFRKKLKENSSV